MSEPTPRSDPDAWLDDVRRWYFGGTPPLNYADSELPVPPPAVPTYSPADAASSAKKASTAL